MNVKKLLLNLRLTLITGLLYVSASFAAEPEQPVVIAIHGGAGTISKALMTPEQEKAYHAKLKQALRAGYRVLTRGGSSVEAVQASIIVMEDSPLFNAGKGAVYSSEGDNQLDASIMRGDTLNAGAVTGVRTVKNPITLAAKVMSQSKHVMLSGSGAEDFARLQGLEPVEPGYFYSERRWQQLQKIKAQEKEPPRPPKLGLLELQSDGTNPKSASANGQPRWPDDDKFGTVGAVALDRKGVLAAGTSTGGMSNKKFGRIGDSPIIGAGTYADNNACAVSATGHGEYFIRAAVAHDICARVLYKGISLQQAADEVIQQKLVKMTAEGGVVALSKQGDPVFSFNSTGMYRGYIDKTGKVYTAIFTD